MMSAMASPTPGFHAADLLRRFAREAGLGPVDFRLCHRAGPVRWLNSCRSLATAEASTGIINPRCNFLINAPPTALVPRSALGTRQQRWQGTQGGFRTLNRRPQNVKSPTAKR